MNAADPFTKASGYFTDATRSLRPFKEGEAFQVMPGRINWLRWTGALLIGAFVGWATIACDAPAILVGGFAFLGFAAVWSMSGWRRA